MFEVDVKNVTEEGREGEDQARFFTRILLIQSIQSL